MTKPRRLGYYKPVKPNSKAWPIKRRPGYIKEVPKRGNQKKT